MISFEHVTKRYGSFAAVDDLSFEVKEQQAVALWGPNGAGKTTVIKCLLGLLRYQGAIRVNGLVAEKDGKALRRLVGYVPQELAFYDDLSTLDTARFFAQLKQAPLSQVPAVLAQMGLEEHTAKHVSALSGGMKQRLALGLALLADPPVLVLDEPTSNLDTGARSQFLSLLNQVKASGKTVLFTSHRLEELDMLADRVLVMENGRLQADCKPSELPVRLGLRTQIKLRMDPQWMDAALRVLQSDGFAARRNGVGVLVDVLPGEKVRPIYSLSQANIPVVDIELE